MKDILKLKKELAALSLKLCLEDIQDSQDPNRTSEIKRVFHNKKRNIKDAIAKLRSKNGS